MTPRPDALESAIAAAAFGARRPAGVSGFPPAPRFGETPMTHLTPRIPRALALAAPVACLLAMGALGAAADEDAPRYRLLAEEALSPTARLRASEIVMTPGETVPSHRHAGSVFVYVIDGAVRSQIDDGPVVLYHAGDGWFEPEGVVHTLAQNASDAEPARLLLVLVGPPDAESAVREE